MFNRPTVRRTSHAVTFAAALVCQAAFAAAPATDARALKAALAQNASLPTVAPIADEAFTRRSAISQVKLSPNGATIAFLEAVGNDTSLQLLDPESGVKRKLLTLTGRNELHWSTDSTVIFIDSGGALAAVTTTDGTSNKIAAFDNKLEQRFVSVDHTSSRHALVESYDRAAKAYRISRVGSDGSTAPVYSGQKIDGFLLNAAGNIHVSRLLDKEFNAVIYRMHNGAPIEVRRCPRLRACHLVAASPDGRYVTMVVNHQADRKALVRIDTATRKEKMLHSDPLGIADLSEPLAPISARTPLIAVYDLPSRRNYGLSPAAQNAASRIAERFPAANVTISASDTAKRWLLTERSARLQQARYWLYEVASGKVNPILERERKGAQALEESQLSAKIALTYRGSDGATLHGYLSLPPGRAAATLPMVTMVHGGPWGKFDNSYTPFVQLLVNRGYAVFQPNFRASIGYGDKYMLAPGADFGNGRVQADIIDGVRWLLANGVGDKERLAIMGDSFGGYSTLLALTHTPDLFKFGMATVPPTNFVRVMKVASSAAPDGDEPPFGLKLKEMGIDLDDTALMQKMVDSSPGANPDRIVRPLLILAGGKDHLVDVASITDYVATLQGKGKPVTLLLDSDEGHNPRKPLTRQAYSYLLQRMLQEHLGGPAVPAPSAELAHYLAQTVKVNKALKAL